MLITMIKLYDYQKKAIDELRTGSILCGGVGSGKSRTALGYYILKVCNGTIYKEITMKKSVDLYIITTARKRDSLEWEKECSLFLLSTDDKISLNKTKVVIDSWNNVSKYYNVENAFFIFDEQRVVGSGKWAMSFVNIGKHNDWILLSATPGDQWIDYIPVFLANGFYKNRTEFLKRHVVFSRFSKYPKIDRYLDEDILEKYRSKILVNMDYLKKTETNNIYVKTSYDKTNMKMIQEKRWNIYEERPIDNASEYCYVMRKLVNSDSDRLTALMNILQKHRKLIVFYNFNYELDILKEFCDNNGIEYSEWNGHKHQPLPKGKRWIYLVQYTAGAEGWNCIKTDTVVFYSQNYSYKIMHQAAGRIDRLNTPYSVLYNYHLISDSFIDISIKKALDKKTNFNESSLKFSDS